MSAAPPEAGDSQTQPGSLRILVVTPAVPCPDQSSGDRRLVAILGLLARTHRLDLIVPEEAAEAPTPEAIARLAGLGIHTRGVGAAALRRALLSGPYDLVLFEFYAMFRRVGAIMRRAQPQAILVIDTVDVHFQRDAGAVALGVLEESAMLYAKERELEAYRRADALLVVSDRDEVALRAEGITTPQFAVSNILPLRPRREGPRGAKVLFVGGFRHAPNVDGVLWFAHEVWPTVRAAVQDASFQIVGSHMPAEIRSLASLPGVEPIGYVPDVGPYLDDACVSIAPLRYGAGMKGKVNEALASGVPVVTTTFGVQGMAIRPGIDALVEDGADGFAAAVISVLNSPAAADRLGRAGHLVAERFSPAHSARVLAQMIATLIPEQRMSRWLAWSAGSADYAIRWMTKAALSGLINRGNGAGSRR